MSFIIKRNENVVSLICSHKNKILSALKDKDKFLYYLSDKKVEDIEEPYSDIEQALDDLEYTTGSLPKSIIRYFKNQVNGERVETSSRSDYEIKIEDNFIILRNNEENVQLNGYKDEDGIIYSITNTNLEYLPDYEVLASDFTEDTEDALQVLSDIVGDIPATIIEEFKDKIKSLS